MAEVSTNSNGSTAHIHAPPSTNQNKNMKLMQQVGEASSSVFLNADKSVELVDLSTDDFNAADGFGFGITGNRTMGAYIKIIHGGSAADTDGRLRVGDQLLRINDIELAGLTAEQVARIIRYNQGENGRVYILVAHNGPRSHTNKCRPRTATQPPISGPSNQKSYDENQSPCTNNATNQIDQNLMGGTSQQTKPPINGNKSNVNAVIERIPNELKNKLKDDRRQYSTNEDLECCKQTKAITGRGDAREESDDTQSQTSYVRSISEVNVDTSRHVPNSKLHGRGKVLVSQQYPHSSGGNATPCSDNGSNALCLDIDCANSAPPGKHQMRSPADRFSRKVSPSKVFVHRDKSPNNSLGGIYQVNTVDDSKLIRSEESSMTHSREGSQNRGDGRKKSLSERSIDISRGILSRSPLKTQTQYADELPLVSFDQLGSSNGDSKEASKQRSSGSPDDGRNDSREGKMSNSSQHSSGSVGSHKISWHCPVCLDGASRELPHRISTSYHEDQNYWNNNNNYKNQIASDLPDYNCDFDAAMLDFASPAGSSLPFLIGSPDEVTPRCWQSCAQFKVTPSNYLGQSPRKLMKIKGPTHSGGEMRKTWGCQYCRGAYHNQSWDECATVHNCSGGGDTCSSADLKGDR